MPVIGKAFGEFVEHRYGTPHLSVRDLKARVDAGENLVVLDSRPEPEFRNFSIPGAIDLPGAELVHRFHAAVSDASTLVVVNCAGRTRSIIGAQALINAGVPWRCQFRRGCLRQHALTRQHKGRRQCGIAQEGPSSEALRAQRIRSGRCARELGHGALAGVMV